MADAKCSACGAPSAGTYVCGYCGVLTQARADIDSQRKALDEFHALLQKAEDEARKTLLKTGFLPDHKALLIEAGLRMVPLVQFGSGDPAASRLEAIALKLKLMPQDEESARAVREFEDRVRAHWATDRKFTWGCVIVVLGLIVAAIWLAARSCR